MTMFINGKQYKVVNGQDGFIVKTNLPFAVKVDVKNNKLVVVK